MREFIFTVNCTVHIILAKTFYEAAAKLREELGL